MKELLKLAVEKGFKTKTLTTRWTLDGKLGLKKSENFLVNETCEYLLLCEVQKWLRDKYETNIVVEEIYINSQLKYASTIFSDFCDEDTEWDDDSYFVKYEDALMDGITDSLELIKNDN